MPSTHQMYTMAQEQKLMAPVRQATCGAGQGWNAVGVAAAKAGRQAGRVLADSWWDGNVTTCTHRL